MWSARLKKEPIDRLSKQPLPAVLSPVLCCVHHPQTGDVLLHTVTDAILGALSLPDIGELVRGPVFEVVLMLSKQQALLQTNVCMNTKDVSSWVDLSLAAGQLSVNGTAGTNKHLEARQVAAGRGIAPDAGDVMLLCPVCDMYA